jgi:ParB family transcriptional regulator, chromosome partitioning protein
VVAEAGGASFVLVDGYRRVAALRRLGHDTVLVECWECGLTEALLGVLARAEGRPFAAIEEALLMRDLIQGSGLSQHDVAQRCGRDVSWVCRRLELLSGLSDGALAALRKGELSLWAATRVLVPLARANSKHADQLLARVRGAGLSTRDLRCWFEHYQKASRTVRERMVDEPRLFLQAVQENHGQRASKRLHDGPEGECAADLQCLEAVLARLHRRLLTLRPLPAFLRTALPRLQAAITTLTTVIERDDDHDPNRDQPCGAHPGRARSQPARDQPHVGPVP